MRGLKIMLLHFEHIAEHRLRSFVWFLISLFNPLLFILFWLGFFQGKNEITSGWTMSAVTSYYFLLTIAGAALMSHSEEDVAYDDIQNGQLANYLLKPYSYFWIKFFEQIHYRFLQGFYALIVFGIFSFLFNKLVKVSSDPKTLILGVVIVFLALISSQIFKMIIGFLAFWTTDIRGIFNLVEIILVIFAGYIVPINLLADPLAKIAKTLPFAYMIYYPVVAFQGGLKLNELFNVIFIQVVWLVIFIIIYRFLWKEGIKKFSAVGQ